MRAYCLVFFGLLLNLMACQQAQEKASSTTDAAPELVAAVPDSFPASPVDSVHLREAKEFCWQQKLDTTLAFFVDMGIHSGKNRFFVYHFPSNTVLYRGLCCHGVGKGSTEATPVFSNAKNSNCTSLGKYKLGVKALSNWGIFVHYKMHGLDSTNSNAFRRIVVLHSYEYVPEEEIYPQHLPMGWSQGCPVVSNQLMTHLDSLLTSKKLPVLLWIYQ